MQHGAASVASAGRRCTPVESVPMAPVQPALRSAWAQGSTSSALVCITLKPTTFGDLSARCSELTWTRNERRLDLRELPCSEHVSGCGASLAGSCACGRREFSRSIFERRTIRGVPVISAPAVQWRQEYGKRLAALPAGAGPTRVPRAKTVIVFHDIVQPRATAARPCRKSKK